MRIGLLVIGTAMILLSACVPNRKIVYVQKDDLKHRDEIPKDTVLRTHDLKIKEYRIQPLDLLSINFESLGDEGDKFDFLDKLSTQVRGSGGSGSGGAAAANGILVDTDGNIDYPVLGKIHVGGLTLFQVRDSLQKVAQQFVPDVSIRVRMLNFRFTVLGEVNGEKTVVSNNTRVNMLEAIGLAGGLTELADRSHVKVIRQVGKTTEIYYLNLLEEQLIESPHYYVQQNDVIVVPPLRQRTFRRYFSPNVALVASSISFVLLLISLTQ